MHERTTSNVRYGPFGRYRLCSRCSLGRNRGFLGPENVLCVMMPSPFSSTGSVSDSEELVRNLGCESRIEPISEAFEVLLKQLNLHKPTKGGESLPLRTCSRGFGA
ncbi:MAG: hypothetical protein R2682_06205 [Pyrinomonadaceae bacterium]